MLSLSRLAALLLLVLHAAMAGVLPVADARAEARSAAGSAAAHVEAPDAVRCPAVHDEQACQLCPMLRLAGPAAGRVALPAVARTVVAPAVARTRQAALHGRAAPAGARAPPVA
jgi:hypothetical protein